MLSDEPVYEAKMLRGNTPFHFSIEQEQVQLRREQTEKTGKTPVPKEKKKRKSGTIFSKYFPKWFVNIEKLYSLFELIVSDWLCSKINIKSNQNMCEIIPRGEKFCHVKKVGIIIFTFSHILLENL